MKRFQGGLVFKAYRLVYLSTLGLRVIKKKKRVGGDPPELDKEGGVSDPGQRHLPGVRVRDARPVCLRERQRLPRRKVDVRLPGKGNSNSHGARPVHQTIPMIK